MVKSQGFSNYGILFRILKNKEKRQNHPVKRTKSAYAEAVWRYSEHVGTGFRARSWCNLSRALLFS